MSDMTCPWCLMAVDPDDKLQTVRVGATEVYHDTCYAEVEEEERSEAASDEGDGD